MDGGCIEGVGWIDECTWSQEEMEAGGLEQWGLRARTPGLSPALGGEWGLMVYSRGRGAEEKPGHLGSSQH